MIEGSRSVFVERELQNGEVVVDLVTVKMLGSGFQPGERVTFTTLDSDADSQTREVTANSSGAFIALVNVFESEFPSGTPVTILASGDQGSVASAAYVIVE